MEKRGFRKAIFVVVYKVKDKKILYLLLKRKLHWKGWEFVKGGVEKNESPIKASKREVFEETGLKPLIVKDHHFYGYYKYKKNLPERPFIGQSFALYSAEVPDKKVKVDTDEHSIYAWLPFNKAIKKLTWENQKDCLRRVNNFLIG